MSLVCYTLRKHYIILYITTACMFVMNLVPSVHLKYLLKGQLKYNAFILTGKRHYHIRHKVQKVCIPEDTAPSTR